MVQDAVPVAHKVQSAAQAGGTAVVGAVRALILTGFGINCEEEVAAAYRLVGAEATIVHLNQVLHGQVSIHDFDILNFPGGFSFGDDLGSGVVLANKLRYRQHGPDGRTLLDDIRQFIAAGKFVFGICNGFQVLCESHLLPGALVRNDHLHFICRDQRLRIESIDTVWTSSYAEGQEIVVPLKNGEGGYVADEATLDRLEGEGRVVARYLEVNPNGSRRDIAGISNARGNVVGLMPHPEHAVETLTGPTTDGLGFFTSILKGLVEA